MITYEAQRYEDVKNFRTEAIERAFLFKEEKLYRKPAPWEVDEGFGYSQASLPKGKFATVEAALEACRKVLDGG